MKSMKRIHSVTIKRMIDESPDTSWLGEYSNRATSEFSIDRGHSLDCQSLEHNHSAGVEQLERVIAYLDTVRQMSEPPENIYWAAADEAQDTLIELQDELMQCDCGGRGDMERGEYQYFNPSGNYTGEPPEDIRKYTRQDYERMERLNRGDWCFIGIRAEATYHIDTRSPVTGECTGASGLQILTSGGLWGIESDSDKAYLTEIESEQLSELREQLYAIGFSKRAIATAFKNVEHDNR